jgi:hypothetical protein
MIDALLAMLNGRNDRPVERVRTTNHPGSKRPQMVAKQRAKNKAARQARRHNRR